MGRAAWRPILVWAGLLAMTGAAQAQQRPYIGFVYPAGGQQGTTVAIRLGGQNLGEVDRVLVTGDGISAKVVEYFPRMGNQEARLLREQFNECRKAARKGDADRATREIMDRIERRMDEYENNPACASICSLVFAEVTIAPDAAPGAREIRVASRSGVTNPMMFRVDQFPEFSRPAMKSAMKSVLGKEEQALRKRPPEEEEQVVKLPCTVNGQIASGEVNRYRFQARKGQRLVLVTYARQLVPYIADAVPGWFQPVLSLRDSAGKEVAYDDDFRFKPDPIIYYEVPEDDEYVLSVSDAIYRGREDFVYRVTISESPYLTGIFPLGAQPGAIPEIQLSGWNLEEAGLTPPPRDAEPGIYWLSAHRDNLVTNPLPFVVDPLPQILAKETGDSAAQDVTLPVVVNGRIDRPDDWDAFRFTGMAGETVVAEVSARRLESPLDSVVKICNSRGVPLAVNDDNPHAGAGTNTHDADSYLSFQLPADGAYTVQLGDTARHGGQAYAYRLRISKPMPDFELRAVPASLVMRRRSSGSVTVYVSRRDGFDGDITLALKDPPRGFYASPVTLKSGQDTAKFTVRTDRLSTERPVEIRIEGKAALGEREIVREAVPAEDRMQAFLWRHLVPAENLPVVVFDPNDSPPSTRVYTPPETPLPRPAGPTGFTKRQVAGRIRQLNALYESWLLTDDFYGRKLAECEAAMEP